MSDEPAATSEGVSRLRWIASQPEIEAIAELIRDFLHGSHTAIAVSALIRVTGEVLSTASPQDREKLLAMLVPALRERIRIAETEGRVKGHG